MPRALRKLFRLMIFRFLIISWPCQFLNEVSIILRCWDILAWSFNEVFTLAKLKMPISQQQNMIETWFKNWQVQKNQLYKMRNMGRGAYWGRGAYYGEYGIWSMSDVGKTKDIVCETLYVNLFLSFWAIPSVYITVCYTTLDLRGFSLLLNLISSCIRPRFSSPAQTCFGNCIWVEWVNEMMLWI